MRTSVNKFTKINLIFFILIILTGCSFDSKSGIWKEKKQEDKNHTKIVKLSGDQKTFSRNFNKDFTINFSRRKETIRFSAPKNSLVTAIKNEIFDDMLIGNFMKTQLINIKSLYPDFTPYVTKYADNGMAKNKMELNKYFKHYKLNSADYWKDFFVSKTEAFVRKNFSAESPVYKASKVIHKKFVR